jgi:predicted metal-dependent hydrolase
LSGFEITKHELVIDGRTIPFELHRKPVRHLNLNLKLDGTVLVSAAERVPLYTIYDFLRKKSAWLQKNMKDVRKQSPETLVPKTYESGESFRYLGKQYRLRVVPTEKGEDNYIELSGMTIRMRVEEKSTVEQRRALLDAWFQERAITVFHEVLNRMYPFVAKYHVKMPRIESKQMKTRWGSCSRKRHVIVLNEDLIKVPISGVEYVVLHELIHFLYWHHDQEFYDMLTVCMPDWRVRKQLLDEVYIRQL